MKPTLDLPAAWNLDGESLFRQLQYFFAECNACPEKFDVSDNFSRSLTTRTTTNPALASSSTQEPPDGYEWCYCDHTCGMHGKPVKPRTLQKHWQRTKDNEASLQRNPDLANSSQNIDGSDNDDDTDQDARMTSPDGVQNGGDDDSDAGGGGDYMSTL
ncbi:hypothetical protein R3P38DRAFT_2811976 [Favolaschia claudopus]|uniref:Uncharacterized protein n=1 Tax=Favolaschia claudopus TaxID=2862362 RepID=A0AAV9Z803_9AGAR